MHLEVSLKGAPKINDHSGSGSGSGLGARFPFLPPLLVAGAFLFGALVAGDTRLH